MTAVRFSEVKALRKRIDPEIQRRVGTRTKPDNHRLFRLVDALGIGTIEDLNETVLVDLIAESGWAESRVPSPELEHQLVVNYKLTATGPDSEQDVPRDPVLGTEPVTLRSVTVVGGSGWPLMPGREIDCVFFKDRIEVHGHMQHLLTILYVEIEAIQLHGGTEVTGGGLIGGGFGLEGAAVGMLTAGALNALTTTTKAYTLLEITTRDGELFLFHEGSEPAGLRIALSHTFTRIRVNQRPTVERSHAALPDEATDQST